MTYSVDTINLASAIMNKINSLPYNKVYKIQKVLPMNFYGIFSNVENVISEKIGTDYSVDCSAVFSGSYNFNAIVTITENN